jgi:hypothetical protein
MTRMSRFRAEVVFYFDAEDIRSVPKRLRALNESAGRVGFDIHGSKVEEGSEPEPDEDGWTSYAPLSDPPTN